MLAAVGLGFPLAFLYNGGFLIPGQSDIVLMHLTHPELYHGDEALFKVMDAGYYLFGERMLGRILAAAGVHDGLTTVLELLQSVFWVIQISFFYLLARRLVRKAWMALVITLLFAWWTPLFRLPDAPYMPTNAFGRSMAFTLIMPSLYLYFIGKKWPAWLLTLGSVYLHANPGIHLLMLYGLNEGLECIEQPRTASSFAGRLLAAAVVLAPQILGEKLHGVLPPAYVQVAYMNVNANTAFPPYASSDWLLFFQGIAFVLLAWRAFRLLPDSMQTRRFFISSGILVGVSVLSRVLLHPRQWPLGTLLMKVTGDFTYLFCAEMLSLIVVSYAILGALERKPMRAFPALAAFLALVSSHSQDFVLRFLGLALLLCLAQGWEGLSWLAALSWLGASCLWQIFGGSLAPIIIRGLHLGGGLFSLPAFHWPSVVAGALLLLVGGSLRRSKALPLAVPAAALVALAAGVWAFPRPMGPPDRAWIEMKNWIRMNTPRDSFVLLPIGGNASLFWFMIGAERSGFSTDDRYYAMLAEHGPSALPMVRRLEDLGYDSSCCRTSPELAVEIERVYRGLDARRIRAIQAKYGLTHAIVCDPYDPLPALKPLHRSGSCRIYGL